MRDQTIINAMYFLDEMNNYVKNNENGVGAKVTDEKIKTIAKKYSTQNYVFYWAAKKGFFEKTGVGEYKSNVNEFKPVTVRTLLRTRNAYYNKNYRNKKQLNINFTKHKPMVKTPKVQPNIKKQSSKTGCKTGEIRATFIVKEEHLSVLKAISYWDRVNIKDVLDAALSNYIDRYGKTKSFLKKY